MGKDTIFNFTQQLENFFKYTQSSGNVTLTIKRCKYFLYVFYKVKVIQNKKYLKETENLKRVYMRKDKMTFWKTLKSNIAFFLELKFRK